MVIPKSVNPKRIAENFKATQVLLDADEIKRIKAIDKNRRLFRVKSLFWYLGQQIKVAKVKLYINSNW